MSAVETDHDSDLEALYATIAARGFLAIGTGKLQFDPYLNHPDADQRRGLTLLIRIGGTLGATFHAIQEALRRADPGQYYYPPDDLHLTVLSLISASADFRCAAAEADHWARLAAEALRGITPFVIGYRGIVPSEAAIIAKGFYTQGLAAIRAQIRRMAARNDMNLRERYQSIAAHVTLARFRVPPNDNEKLLAMLHQYHDVDLGELRVNQLDLVIHDWYNHSSETIAQFTLGREDGFD